MGRKRAALRKLPKKLTLKHAITIRLRELAGDTSAAEIAEHVGVTPDAVLKWLRGAKYPDIDKWPAIATYFGFTDYRKMLPKAP